MEIIKYNYLENITSSSAFNQYFGDLSMGILDIETTGLSPKNSHLVLAGLLTAGQEGNSFTLKQFWAENIRQEEELLYSLGEALVSLDFVVTYNGASFDMPFFCRRRTALGLEPLVIPYQLDLYRLVKGFSEIGKFTPNLKQKTLENFMGIWHLRDDTISGGDSLNMYFDFLSSGEQALKDAILLHNRDDVMQLHRLLYVMSMVDLHKALHTFGFPVYRRDFGYVVEGIFTAKANLIINGRQNYGHISCVVFGEEKPSYTFNNGSFTISIPLISHKNMYLIDLINAKVPMEASSSDYLIVSREGQINYRLVSEFAIKLLERINKKWNTENLSMK